MEESDLNKIEQYTIRSKRALSFCSNKSSQVLKPGQISCKLSDDKRMNIINRMGKATAINLEFMLLWIRVGSFDWSLNLESEKKTNDTVNI